MSKLASTRTINDMAESIPEASEPSRQNPSRTGIAPAVPMADDHGAPAAETGLVAKVVLNSEGKENTDEQDARRTTAERQSSPEGLPASSKSAAPSILIIEDSAELAEIIEATLQRLEMVTTHETHGGKAFNRFYEVRPDVVLLDIGLPDMTGWKLLENIREKHGEGKMPKIVVMTAYGDPANRLIGKLQNVHDYLIKPFTAEEVERVVLGALSSSAGA
jgi:CheY-like chemotaxis protein